MGAMSATSGPMPGPAPVGDVDNRRISLTAMLEYANNTAQPVARDINIVDHQVTTGDGTTIERGSTARLRATVGSRSSTCTAAE